ncbi:MAG: hypothetical protein AAGA70_09290 [Pseudomonadota bacterium]
MAATERPKTSLRAAAALAEAEDTNLVTEKVEDIDPAWQRDLAAGIASDAIRVAKTPARRAPRITCPVNYLVFDAGELSAHIRLQDADGFAVRHMRPGRRFANWQLVLAADVAKAAQAPGTVTS